VDKAYFDKNVDHCKRMIESYNARIKNAKATGENVSDLKESLAGYSDKLAELNKEKPQAKSTEA